MIMKKMILSVFLFLTIGMFSSVSAASEVRAVYGETYLCGDSFEIMIQSEPIITTMITGMRRGTDRSSHRRENMKCFLRCVSRYVMLPVNIGVDLLRRALSLLGMYGDVRWNIFRK